MTAVRVVWAARQSAPPPDTLLSINNYAGLLKAIGVTQAAKPLYEEALDARRETLGE